MSDQLFLQERRRAILDHLQQEGRVSVKTLSDELNVSTVTIRQDLRALEATGLLERTYGGAVLRTGPTIMPELSFALRQQQKAAEKRAMGAAAAAHIDDQCAIAMDGSTTCFALVPYLKQRESLTVVTNSLMLAQQFLDAPHIEVLMPGGKLRRDSISLVGQPDNLPKANLNLGIFGAYGMTLDAGATEISREEWRVKQAMAEQCVAVMVVIDSSKWGRVAPYTYCPASNITHIVTTEYAPDDLIDPVRQAGVQVEKIPVAP